MASAPLVMTMLLGLFERWYVGRTGQFLSQTHPGADERLFQIDKDLRAILNETAILIAEGYQAGTDEIAEAMGHFFKNRIAIEGRKRRTRY